MYIKQVLSICRQDFRAIYACQWCGFEHESYGYNDKNFHCNVIPREPCPRCGRTAMDIGGEAAEKEDK